VPELNLHAILLHLYHFVNTFYCNSKATPTGEWTNLAVTREGQALARLDYESVFLSSVTLASHRRTHRLPVRRPVKLCRDLRSIVFLDAYSESPRSKIA
jgi:hypothetical protein